MGFFPVLFLYEVLFSQKKSLQWNLCLQPKADGCSKIGTAFPRSWCWVVLSTSLCLTLRQEGSQISRGLCVCTSASHKVGGCIPWWSAWIKGGEDLIPFLPSAWSLPLLVTMFVRAVLQNRCDGLDQFHQCVRNKQIFPTTSVLCMCFLFYSSFSFKCFYYELGDETSLFWALFQSWVPFIEYPTAINLCALWL